MSGRRQKALRRAFRERHGRAPGKAGEPTMPGTVAGFPKVVRGSEWRRLKKYGPA